MPAFLLPLGMMAASAISGYMANKKKTTTTTPTYGPEFSPLKNALITQIMARLNQTSALPQGYETGQVRDINKTYGAAEQTLANRLTARGMGSSPVAANALTNMQLGRAGSIAEMQSSLPMVERTFRNQDMAMGQSVLGMGKGVASTDPGNPWGGAFQSGAEMLAYLYGKGAFSTGKKPGAGMMGNPVPLDPALGGGWG